MSVKLTAAFALGALAALAVSAVSHQPEAQAQKPERGLQWEYRVVALPVSDTVRDTEKTLTRRLNELAAENWEFVGPANSTYFVVFKRPKR